MRLGFGSWRLSPAAFWSMTPREVAAVLRAAAPATPDRSRSSRSRGMSWSSTRSWGRYPIRCRPGMDMVPSSASAAPARIRRSVVFPDPLGPTRPTLAPSGTSTERRSKRRRSPKRSDTSCMHITLCPSFDAVLRPPYPEPAGRGRKYIRTQYRGSG